MKTTTLCIGLTLAVAGAANGQCIQGDINGDGTVNGIDLAYVLQNWGQSCPAVIDAVSPPSGLPAGGTMITITGEQLGGVLSVTIGGVPATNVVGVNATTITAVTPPSKSLGPVDVVVTTTGSSAALTGGFNYATLDWATVLEYEPDPAVITDPVWRERIIATGHPWRIRDNASQIEMLLVPSGTFVMGCTPSNEQPCYDNEHPTHEVTLTASYYLGRYEVTQSEWTGVMGFNPSYWYPYPDSDVRPVDSVAWVAVQDFELATNLRLPTEAEWEYACRAGSTTAFNHDTSDDQLLGDAAWCTLNNGPPGSSTSGTKPVGLKEPNQLGFHDMHGNVAEWCEDWYGDYIDSPSVDPLGPAEGIYRISRGGLYARSPGQCRSSYRYEAATPNWAGAGSGFRVARNP